MTPPDARRTHPLTPLFNLILVARQIVVPTIGAAIAGRGATNLLILVPSALGLVASVLQWLRLTYSFDGHQLVVDQGVLTRKQRILPVDRIQQVDIEAKLRHRIFGVAVLRVETASGTQGPEVQLSVLSNAEASRLRTALLQVAGADETSIDTTEGRVSRARVELGIGRLALAGVTGSELAAVLTVGFWLSQLGRDAPRSILGPFFERAERPSTPLGFTTFALLALVTWLVVAAAASVVKRFGYRMVLERGDVRVTYGLGDRSERTAPLHRVQAVRVQENAVRRVLGVASVRIQNAGGAGTAGQIDVPLLDGREVSALLADVLRRPAPPVAALAPHPPAARRRAIVRRLLAVAPFVLAGIGSRRPALVVVAATLVVVAVAAGELAYRGLGHARADGALVSREGGLLRETVVVPVAKLQSTRLRSTPWQRRSGLASLFVDVAGKGDTPVVKDAGLHDLVALQRQLHEQPEASFDEATVRQSPSVTPP